MTIPIRNAHIDVYKGHDEQPNVDEDPDITIPSSDIEQISVSSRTDEIMDQVKVALHNPDDRYTETTPLKQADRITYIIDIPQQGSTVYGGGVYGGVSWGGRSHLAWTGRIVDISGTRGTAAQSTLDITARDYPADILSNRKLTNAYIDEDVGAIIRDILRRKAPEVDRSVIQNLGVITDAKYSSADCWDTIIDLAARADAVVVPEGQKLRVVKIPSLPYRFELADADIYSPVKTTMDDEIKNVVRIDSGENRKIEEAQETVDHFERITSDSPDAHRLRARKSQIHSIEIYVRNRSEDQLKLRLQSDQNGAPVNIEDEDSDIATATWDSEDLPEDGWKSFFFDEHILADRDPWLIIESGDTGHDHAHDANGNLTYRSYYPHPLNFEVTEPASVNQYGMRELRIERANLKTLTAVRGAARSELARRAWPRKTVTFDARSSRAHYLKPGDRIDINRPGDDIEGEHIVTDVDREWAAGNMSLDTAITAEWRKGVLAPIG